MRGARAIALIAALWFVSLIVDVILLPERNYPVVYVIPVAFAAARASPRTVLVTSIAVLLTDLVDIYRAHITADIWSITLLSLAAICALAVWISVVRERLAQYASDQQGLAQTAEVLVEAPTLENAAQVIAEQAQRILSVAAVQLWEADHHRQEWRLIAARGIAPETEERVRHLPFDEAVLLNDLLRTDEILEIPDLSTSKAALSMTREVVAHEGFRSALVQPLSTSEQVVGAVSYIERAPRRFTHRDRERIRPLGHLWAVAIENSHLHDDALRGAREAEEARARLQSFLGLVAHDLRGPLTTVRGYAQLLRQQATTTPLDRESRALRAIEDGALRMQRLIGDLLDASRIGAGRFDVEPEPMDLTALVERTVEQMRAKSTTHTLILDAPEPLEGVWDPVRLSQVVENLLSNAIKYSPSEAEIVVQVRRQGNEACLRVTDHGIGIAPEQLPQLFQPFHRSAPTRATKGIGLGLYIARGIIEAMHGRITVESTVGQGTTFSVVLPIQ